MRSHSRHFQHEMNCPTDFEVQRREALPTPQFLARRSRTSVHVARRHNPRRRAPEQNWGHRHPTVAPMRSAQSKAKPLSHTQRRSTVETQRESPPSPGSQASPPRRGAQHHPTPGASICDPLTLIDIRINRPEDVELTAWGIFGLARVSLFQL